MFAVIVTCMWIFVLSTPEKNPWNTKQGMANTTLKKATET